MARRTAVLVALAAVLLASPRAGAQALQRLTVQSFVMSTDTAHPRVDVPFHVLVTLRVRERVPEILNLELPMLAALELLGDERQTVATAQGTQYRESITVVAHATGDITLAAATLQAIDARDGKPKQWFSNGLIISMGSPPGGAFGSAAHAAEGALIVILQAIAWIFGILCVIALAVFALRRRRPRPAPIPAPVAAPIAVRTRSRREQIEDALAVLRAEPVRATAIRIRTVVWAMTGAGEGETLGDVLRRAPGPPELRDVLISLERSAFTYDDDVAAAIADACGALERYAETLP